MRVILASFLFGGAIAAVLAPAAYSLPPDPHPGSCTVTVVFCTFPCKKGQMLHVEGTSIWGDPLHEDEYLRAICGLTEAKCPTFFASLTSCHGTSPRPALVDDTGDCTTFGNLVIGTWTCWAA